MAMGSFRLDELPCLAAHRASEVVATLLKYSSSRNNVKERAVALATDVSSYLISRASSSVLLYVP